MAAQVQNWIRQVLTNIYFVLWYEKQNLFRVNALSDHASPTLTCQQIESTNQNLERKSMNREKWNWESVKPQNSGTVSGALL